jgi:ABC-type polysaccharide/polyol phosphate transport system ATPase subunit
MLRKMGQVAKAGRTIMSQSHNLAIEQLCNRAILLRDGLQAYDGRASDACEIPEASGVTKILENQAREGDGRVDHKVGNN